MNSMPDPALVRFVPLDHEDFRKLSFHDQLHAVGLYTFHKDEYEAVCREKGYQTDPAKLPAAIRKVTEAMLLLDRLRAEGIPEPEPGFALQAIRQWAGYRCLYPRQWGPVDREMFHALNHWVVNVRLFHLPILALTARAFYLWDRLARTRPNTPSAHMVILVALMLTYADQEGIEDAYLTDGRMKKRDCQGRFKKLHEERGRVWRKLYPTALAKLSDIRTLADLQAIAPRIRDDADGSLASVIAPDPSHVRFGSSLRAHKLPRYCEFNPFSLVSRRLTVLGQPRCSHLYVHLPIIPEFFYLRDTTFTVRDWDLLR